MSRLDNNSIRNEPDALLNLGKIGGDFFFFFFALWGQQVCSIRQHNRFTGAVKYVPVV